MAVQFSGRQKNAAPTPKPPPTVGAGKKIRWWDGVVALWTLVKYRFRD